jgi:hypothetical protein
MVGRKRKERLVESNDQICMTNLYTEESIIACLYTIQYFSYFYVDLENVSYGNMQRASKLFQEVQQEMSIMRLLIGCMELDIGREANRVLGTWKLPKTPTGLKDKPQFFF